MDLQAEPARWTQVWFAACCCSDVFRSENCPREVEGLERQSGMLGRAASAVTLSCGRGTRAGKQKDKHQKLQFFAVQSTFVFPPMRNQRLKQYGCSSKKLCSVFVIP